MSCEDAFALAIGPEPDGPVAQSRTGGVLQGLAMQPGTAQAPSCPSSVCTQLSPCQVRIVLHVTSLQVFKAGADG